MVPVGGQAISLLPARRMRPALTQIVAKTNRHAFEIIYRRTTAQCALQMTASFLERTFLEALSNCPTETIESIVAVVQRVLF